MIEAMKFWVREADIDYYRCDMAPRCRWISGWKPGWPWMAVKPLFWLAETEEISYHQAFDATYSWELLHTLEKYWKKRKPISMPIDGFFQIRQCLSLAGLACFYLQPRRKLARYRI